MKKTTYILTLLILSFFAHKSYAQRFSTGINFSTIAYQKTSLPDNFIYSQNSYYVYYTANEKKDNEPVFNQFFNGLSGGLNANVDYKRFMLKYEFSFGYSNIKIPVLYPTPFLPDLVESDWSTFVLKRSAFKHNLLISTKINNKTDGAYLLTGLQYTFDYYKEQDKFNLDADISSGIYLYISNNELYGTLYNNNNSYFKGIIGLGIKRKNNYYSIRYLKRVFGQNDNYPLANYQQIEMTFTKTLTFQNLRRGYAIYIEE